MLLFTTASMWAECHVQLTRKILEVRLQCSRLCILRYLQPQMQDLSNCEKGRIIGVLLAEGSLTKTVELYYVSRVTVFRQWQHTRNKGKQDQGSIKKLILKNDETTAVKFKAEPNTHLSNTVPTKTVRRELHKANIHRETAVAKTFIMGANVKARKK